MKTTIHKQHPIFLKLQDIIELSKKLQEPCEWAIRDKNGNIIKRQSMYWTLYDYLHGDNRKENYFLNGWYIIPQDLLQVRYEVLDIVEAVELFGEVELEGFDINNILSHVREYERTKCVMHKLEIKL